VSVDRFGLVEDNQYLVVEIPAYESFIPFKVKYRVNRGYERIDYGPIPTTSGTSYPTLDGGTATVPEDGVMPAMAYMPTSDPIVFPASGVGLTYGVSDTDDMFYISEKDFDNRVIHLHASFSPSWLRIVVDMPRSTLQGMYQKATLDINMGMGFRRGGIETVILPAVKIGWRFANDTNMDVYTVARFVYGEYVVDIVNDAEMVFNLGVGKVKAKRVVLPVNVPSYDFEDALRKTWGFTGFKMYAEHEKSIAISEYNEVISELRR